MSIEKRIAKYSGPRLFPDSKEVIYNTGISGLPDEAQKVYLGGGYHTLVGRILNNSAFERTLDIEQYAFLRNRLARELVDLTAPAHDNQVAVNELLEYFDRIADPRSSQQLSMGARHLAVTAICGEAGVCDLIE